MCEYIITEDFKMDKYIYNEYAILIREELAAQNKNKQNRDTISRQFS